MAVLTNLPLYRVLETGVHMIMILAIGNVLVAIQPPLLMLVSQREEVIRILAARLVRDAPLLIILLLINGILIM